MSSPHTDKYSVNVDPAKVGGGAGIGVSAGTGVLVGAGTSVGVGSDESPVQAARSVIAAMVNDISVVKRNFIDRTDSPYFLARNA